MKKIYIAASLARQVDGENCFWLSEKASPSREKIEAYLREAAASYAITVQGVPCVAERSIVEVEIED